jgi:hypothetical protein
MTSIFKIIQQHNNNWEVSILFTQCIVFPTIDVRSLGYGQIYSIILDDKIYDVTIGNFPKCSCVYLVTMLVGFLGDDKVYVQCKHVYHVLKKVMFYGLIEEFMYHYTWSWNEVQRLLKCFKAFELL